MRVFNIRYLVIGTFCFWASSQAIADDDFEKASEDIGFVCSMPINPEKKPTEVMVLAKSISPLSTELVSTLIQFGYSIEVPQSVAPLFPGGDSERFEQDLKKIIDQMKDITSQTIDENQTWTPESVGESILLSRNCISKDGELPIGVHLIEPTKKQRLWVEKYASRWNDGLKKKFYLHFKDDDCNLRRIRVSFSEMGGNKSNVGVGIGESHSIDSPTMNLADVRAGVSEETAKRVIQHEFGHALGLLHEHKHFGGPDWQWTSKLDEHFNTLGWSEAEIQSQIKNKYDEGQHYCLDFDPKSVMIYPIKAEWNEAGIETTPDEIQPNDIACLKKHY